MEGTDSDPGVMYRALQTLLENTSHMEEYHTDITLSLMEVYNEKIRSSLLLFLLLPSPFPLEIS
jgi:hypothetical protein